MQNITPVSHPIQSDLQERHVRKKELFFSSRRGFGTLEVVIIISVLLTIAMIFRHTLISFATGLIDTVFDQDRVIEEIEVEETE